MGQVVMPSADQIHHSDVYFGVTSAHRPERAGSTGRLVDPLVDSAYADRSDYESAINDAATHLAGSRLFRWERETLAIGGVVLGVWTLLKFISLFWPDVSGEFLAPRFLIWAWGIEGVWAVWYLVRVTRWRTRILKARLCMRCGGSLRDVPTSPTGVGRCPRCGTMFRPGEYAPPERCIQALRTARERVSELYPHTSQIYEAAERPIFDPPLWGEEPTSTEWYLYSDNAHFNRVMNDATWNLLSRDSRWPCFSALALLPWLVVGNIAAVFAVGPAALVALPFVLTLATILIMYEHVRLAACRERIIGARRCLECGFALESQPLLPGGGGMCPQCFRTFHEREYIRPPLGHKQPDWLAIRTKMIPRALADLDDADDSTIV